MHVHAPKITIVDKAYDGTGIGYEEAMPSAIAAGSSHTFLKSELVSLGAEEAARLAFSFFAELMLTDSGFTFWETMLFAVNAIRATPTDERPYNIAARTLHKYGHKCEAAQLALWARGFSAAGNAEPGPDLCEGAVLFGAKEVRSAADGLARLPPWYDGLKHHLVQEVVRAVYSSQAYAG